MATETLYLSSHVVGTVTNANNAVGNTPTTWSGDVNTNVSWTASWAFANPVDPELANAQQSVSVRFRKGSNNNNPTVIVSVRDGQGTEVATSGPTTTAITSTTGQDITVSWTPAVGTSSQGYVLHVTQTASGGSPSARNAAQMSHAVWTAQTQAHLPDIEPVDGSVQVLCTVSGDVTHIIGSVTHDAVGQVDVLSGSTGAITRVPLVLLVSGTTSSIATVSGAVDVQISSITHLVEGLSAFLSGSSGAVTARGAVSGVLTAGATSTGALTKRTTASGSLSTLSAVSGTPTSSGNRSGSSVALSQVLGDLTALYRPSGSVLAQSSVNGSVAVAARTYSLQGMTSVSSSMTGALTATVQFSLSVVFLSTVSGSVDVIGAAKTLPVQGNLSIVSQTQGDFDWFTKGLTGSVAVTAGSASVAPLSLYVTCSSADVSVQTTTRGDTLTRRVLDTSSAVVVILGLKGLPLSISSLTGRVETESEKKTTDTQVIHTLAYEPIKSTLESSYAYEPIQRLITLGTLSINIGVQGDFSIFDGSDAGKAKIKRLGVFVPVSSRRYINNSWRAVRYKEYVGGYWQEETLSPTWRRPVGISGEPLEFRVYRHMEGQWRPVGSGANA